MQPALKQFIFGNVLPTLLLFAIPMFFIWRRSRKKTPEGKTQSLSFKDTYKRAQIYVWRFFGLALALVSGIIFICALSDEFGLTHFGGYGIGTIVFSAIMMGAGVALWIFTTRLLNSKKRFREA